MTGLPNLRSYAQLNHKMPTIEEHEKTAEIASNNSPQTKISKDETDGQLVPDGLLLMGYKGNGY